MDFLHGVSSQFADARVRKCVWMSGSIASYLFAGITLACFELLGALFVPKAQFTKQALRSLLVGQLLFELWLAGQSCSQLGQSLPK